MEIARRLINNRISLFFKQINIDLFCVSVLAVIFGVFYWNLSYLFGHDTLQTLLGYFIFYNHFFTTGEIPHWLPYGTFGAQSSYWLQAYISPSGYLVGLIGYVFRITNVVLLFKINLLFDLLILSTGTYWLARHLYKDRFVVLFVCVVTILSTCYFFQIWWNFRIYYILPLVILCIFKFIDNKSAIYFWIAASIGLCSLIGNMLYFAVVWVFAIFIMLSVLTWQNKKMWKPLFTCSFSSLLFGVLTISCVIFYIIFIIESFEHVGQFGVYRDPSTGFVSIERYLTYGGRIGSHVSQYLSTLILGWPAFTNWSHHPDNTLFAGTIVFFLAAYCFTCLSSKDSKAFTFPMIGIFLISCSGTIAAYMYFLGPFRYLRHLGLLGSLLKFFMIFSAGFALKYFISNIKLKHIWLGLIFLIILNELLLANRQMQLVAMLDNTNSCDNSIQCFFQILKKIFTGFPDWGIVEVRISIYFIFGLLFYFFKATRKPNIAKILIITAVVTELLWFQRYIVNRIESGNIVKEGYSYSTWLLHNKNRGQSSDKLLQQKLFNVIGTTYNEERSRVPTGVRTNKILAHINQSFSRGFSADILYGFAGADIVKIKQKQRGNPILRGYPNVQQRNTNVQFLLNTGKTDDEMLNILGFTSPKIRLVPNAIIVKTIKEADNAINSDLLHSNAVVILDQDTGSSNFTQFHQRNTIDTICGHVNVKKFNYNEIIIDAINCTDKDIWLVYSDAYHPGWKATINDDLTKIYQAYIGFKAILLPPGESTVRMYFYQNRLAYSQYFIAITGILFSIVFILCLFTSLFNLGRKQHYY